MNDASLESSRSAVPDAAKRAWLAAALGVDVQPGAGSAGGGAAVLAAGNAGAAAPPAATATDLFFAHDAHDLTDSDRQSLDAYAKAYVAANASDPIVVDAYASNEGDAGHNQALSDARAKAVVEYLTKQGVPKDKVSGAGHGSTTNFSKDDLGQNRRATLKPPPPAAAPAKQSGPRMSMHMRDPLDTRDAARKIVGDDTNVPRDRVLRLLKDFLRDLARSQKTKAVQTTDKVWMAESRLRMGLGGDPVVKRGEVKGYDPDELADKIANNLPDKIPAENVEAFRKLKPRDVPKDKSNTEHLQEKYQETRDAIIKKLPEKLQGPAKKAMDAAVKKGVPFVADAGLKALGLDSNLEGEIKSAVDDYVKKVAGDSSDDNK